MSVVRFFNSWLWYKVLQSVAVLCDQKDPHHTIYGIFYNGSIGFNSLRKGEIIPSHLPTLLNGIFFIHCMETTEYQKSYIQGRPNVFNLYNLELNDNCTKELQNIYNNTTYRLAVLIATLALFICPVVWSICPLIMSSRDWTALILFPPMSMICWCRLIQQEQTASFHDKLGETITSSFRKEVRSLIKCIKWHQYPAFLSGYKWHYGSDFCTI